MRVRWPRPWALIQASTSASTRRWTEGLAGRDHDPGVTSEVLVHLGLRRLGAGGNGSGFFFAQASQVPVTLLHNAPNSRLRCRIPSGNSWLRPVENCGNLNPIDPEGWLG